MGEDYGIDKDFFEKVQKSVKGAIKEKQLLKPNEKKEIIEVYKIHKDEQMELEVKDRTLFVDKYGVEIFLVKSPSKIVKKIRGKISITNKPKITSNKNWRLWGYNIPLFGTGNKITYFSEILKGMLGFDVMALVRGPVTYKYKHTESKEYAKFEKAFVREMRQIYKEDYPEFEVEGLEDIDRDDYFIEHTFNLWEVLVLIEEEEQ
ncbi:unnamed protein product [marine sediment metagenome]|uniref:Uncharacterized protein n=1 Tax=marine sediment metagenome TaxID=412755 RepID=X0TJE5_9ZZZZ